MSDEPTEVATDDVVDKLQKALTREKKTLPHLADAWEDILHQFGGSKEFAAQLKYQYDKTPDGTAHKIKLLQLILGGLQTCTDRNYVDDDDDDPTLMTKAELRGAIEKDMRDFADRLEAGS